MARSRQEMRERQKRRRGGNFQTPGFKGGPQGIIDAATEANKQTAQTNQSLNNFNESNPYGSSEYTRDAQGNITGRTTTLSDNQQAILDGSEKQEMGFQQGVGSAMSQYGQAPGLNFRSLASADPRYTDMPTDATRQRYEQAYLDRSSKLLNKQFDQASQAETANLRARGYQFGGEDYNKLYNDRVANPRNEAMANLAQDAVTRGGQEQVNQFGMQLQANNQNFGQGLQSRNQGIQEQLTMRNQPLQEAATLRGMQQGVTNPQFAQYNPTQMQGVDVAGIGMNFADMANQRFMQNDAQKFQNSQPRGGGGGGGANPNDWYQRALFSHMLGQENMMLQNQLGGFGQQQASPWTQMFGNLAGGVGQGLASAF